MEVDQPKDRLMTNGLFSFLRGLAGRGYGKNMSFRARIAKPSVERVINGYAYFWRGGSFRTAGGRPVGPDLRGGLSPRRRGGGGGTQSGKGYQRWLSRPATAKKGGLSSYHIVG